MEPPGWYSSTSAGLGAGRPRRNAAEASTSRCKSGCVRLSAPGARFAFISGDSCRTIHTGQPREARHGRLNNRKANSRSRKTGAIPIIGCGSDHAPGPTDLLSATPYLPRSRRCACDECGAHPRGIGDGRGNTRCLIVTRGSPAAGSALAVPRSSIRQRRRPVPHLRLQCRTKSSICPTHCQSIITDQHG